MSTGEVKVVATGALGETVDRQALEAVVDADIQRFEKFFCSPPLNNDGLSDQERAIIKTYLWWKTHPQEDASGS